MDVSCAVAVSDIGIDRGPFDGWPVESLESEICSWAANMTAADARWLAMIAEFDRRQGWAQNGSMSCAKWLQDRVGMDRSTAHEKVRVAHALETFPLFALAMSAGVLSYAKVRSITRVATAENESSLLEIALERSSSQVDRFVTALRRCETAADDLEARAFAERSMSYRTEDASMVITIRVPVEAGSVLLATVDRFVDDTERDIPPTARRADAVIEMAEHAVATIDQRGDGDCRYLVTLHLTPDVFADRNDETDGTSGDVDDVVDPAGVGTDRPDRPDRPERDGAAAGRRARTPRRDRTRRHVCCVAPGDGLSAHPVAVSRKTAERILCDAVLQGYRINGGNDVLIGADQRYPSIKLRRAIRLRDGGCMAPGCDRLGSLHSHHIVHWTNGGPTTASNLVCLCRFHHRLVHEGGWCVTGDANIVGGLSFHRPDGTILPAGQELIAGHSRPIDIGCTADAVRPGASVHDQLEMIDMHRRARQRGTELMRRCRTMLSLRAETPSPNSDAVPTDHPSPAEVDPFASCVGSLTDARD